MVTTYRFSFHEDGDNICLKVSWHDMTSQEDMLINLWNVIIWKPCPALKCNYLLNEIIVPFKRTHIELIQMTLNGGRWVLLISVFDPHSNDTT